MHVAGPDQWFKMKLMHTLNWHALIRWAVKNIVDTTYCWLNVLCEYKYKFKYHGGPNVARMIMRCSSTASEFNCTLKKCFYVMRHATLVGHACRSHPIARNGVYRREVNTLHSSVGVCFGYEREWREEDRKKTKTINCYSSLWCRWLLSLVYQYCIHLVSLSLNFWCAAFAIERCRFFMASIREIDEQKNIIVNHHRCRLHVLIDIHLVRIFSRCVAVFVTK